MGIEYIGKCLLISEGGKRILVIGDLHLAHFSRMGVGGMKIVDEVYNGMIKEFDMVFEKVNSELDYIVLLGDLRSGFGRLQEDERNEIGRLVDYFKEKCGEIVVIKGNHDNYVMNVLSTRNIETKEMWKWEKYLFTHGDKKVDDIKMKDIDYIVMGHIHPAIFLEEGAKREKYKCFLIGKSNGKNIIILPSFIDINEGIDILGILDEENEFGFDLKKFEVKIVGDNLEVLDFGKLKDLQ